MLFKIKLEMDDTARSYRAHFLGYEHYNLCGTDDNLGPVVVSVKTYSDLESRSKKGISVDDESVQVNKLSCVYEEMGSSRCINNRTGERTTLGSS